MISTKSLNVKFCCLRPIATPCCYFVEGHECKTVLCSFVECGPEFQRSMTFLEQNKLNIVLWLFNGNILLYYYRGSCNEDFFWSDIEYCLVVSVRFSTISVVCSLRALTAQKTKHWRTIWSSGCLLTLVEYINMNGHLGCSLWLAIKLSHH